MTIPGPVEPIDQDKTRFWRVMAIHGSVLILCGVILLMAGYYFWVTIMGSGEWSYWEIPWYLTISLISFNVLNNILLAPIAAVLILGIDGLVYRFLLRLRRHNLAVIWASGFVVVVVIATALIVLPYLRVLYMIDFYHAIIPE